MMRLLVFLLFATSCVIDTVPLPEGTGGDGARAGGDDSWNNGGGDFVAGVGGDVDDPPSGDCLAVPGTTTAGIVVFRFEAADVAVSITRRYVSAGVGESSIYELDEMRVLAAGGCVAIVDAGDLEYQNSHHNWRDVAVGVAGGVRYELRMDYDVIGGAGWQPTLEASDVGTSAPVIAETALITTGGPLFCWNCPNHLPVMINEVCTANASLLADGVGDFDTWVELFNPSAGDVDLAGYTLDSGARSWTFAAGTVIAQHAYMMVWLDGESGEGTLHADFVLSPADELQLSAANGTSAGERTMTATAADESLVYDAATDAFVDSDAPSPGATNPGGF